MDTRALDLADEHFLHSCEVSLHALLSPIDEQHPGGESVRHNGVYRSIENARREDDPSLPMGPWEHELKRADWDAVSALAVTALRDRSKDLQIAVWLLEAQIHRTGFEGVAPCAVLIRELVERYWDDLHPHVEDGDLEYRTNPLRWANEKLLPVLRQVSITTADGNERPLHWADFELAQRHAQVTGKHGNPSDDDDDTVTLADFETALTATPTLVLQTRAQELATANNALGSLAQSLHTHCGSEAPSLAALVDLLDDIHGLVQGQLRRRGVDNAAPAEIAIAHDAEPARESAATPAAGGDGALRDRDQAYARLAEIAEFLRRIEPHSPVPYLIGQAIDWGAMDSRDLYRELFLEYQGQLSIFEMMGLRSASDRGGGADA